jgi:hypothetical protein
MQFIKNIKNSILVELISTFPTLNNALFREEIQ